MSEANTGTTGFDNTPAPAGTPGATLYPDGGGTGGAATTPLVPAGERGASGSDTQAAPAGTETQAAPAGNDTLTGSDTTTGSDTLTGADTNGGTDAGTGGNDTIEGGAGNDSLTADSYKDKLSLPAEFVADEAMMGEAATLFADLGVAPEKAQGLLDLFAKVTKANADKATADFQTQQTGWVNEINALPEFQGEARATSLQAIGKVFDEYGTPEARAALDAFGTGNNPALVKMFHNIAKALSEGTPTSPGRPTNTGADGKPAASARGKTVGQRLYPDQAG